MGPTTGKKQGWVQWPEKNITLMSWQLKNHAFLASMQQHLFGFNMPGYRKKTLNFWWPKTKHQKWPSFGFNVGINLKIPRNLTAFSATVRVNTNDLIVLCKTPSLRWTHPCSCRPTSWKTTCPEQQISRLNFLLKICYDAFSTRSSCEQRT